MKFRIATWNMDHCKKRKAEIRQQAWQFLDSLNADAALIQEAVPPKDYPKVIWKEINPINRSWGSGIVSRKWKLTEIIKVKEFNLLQTWYGSVAIAQIDMPEVSPITLISCYGLIDYGYAQTTMFRIIADLIPLFDSTLGRRVIFAGDLNISTQLKGKTSQKRHKAILDSIKSLGLVDCLELTKDSRDSLINCSCPEAADCCHVNTHWHNSGSRMQIDYIFATESLAKKLTKCYVNDEKVDFPLNEKGRWKLSDHCPVIAEFEI